MNNIEHLMEISLDGGVLCLDFINTVSDYTVVEPINYIIEQKEWHTWLKRVKLADDGLMDFDKESFDIREILDVRETLYKIFTNYVRGEVLSEKVLFRFNRYCNRMNNRLKFVAVDKGLVETLEYDRQLPNDYLLPIIRSAKELLNSPHLKNVKECPNCGWLYLDKTKSGTRRWCNMKACGNKVKTRKYYRKISNNQSKTNL